MTSRVHVLLLVAAAAAPAHAMVVDHPAPPPERVPVPEISVGDPDDAMVSIARLTADAREVDDTALVTLQVELDGPVDGHAARMALALPDGAKVVGMTFSRGGESLRASARAPLEATEAFQQTVVIKRDPALLEWKSASQLELSVYPVTAREHATATLVIAMPRFRALHVAAGSQHRELIGGTFAAPTDDEVALAREAPMVTSGVSLLAMPPPSFDDIDVRLEKAHAELQQCARLDEGTADVTLTVAIGADGNVSAASAGESAAGVCAARLASAWRFGADAKPIAMHLRLHLSPG